MMSQRSFHLSKAALAAVLVAALIMVSVGIRPLWLGIARAEPELVPGRMVIYVQAPGDGGMSIPAPPLPKNALEQSASITVQSTGFPPDAEQAFQRAADIWASLVHSTMPIVVRASFTPLPTGVLGQAGAATFVRNFQGAPFGATYYPIALANSLAGRDLNGSSPEIVAEFSSVRTDWYFGADGKPPKGMIDFETVVLHELGHGLGFIGAMEIQRGVGTWTVGTACTNCPIVYDRFTRNGAGQPLLSFPNNSGMLAEQLTSNNLFFSGPRTNAAGGPAKLYAPSPWEDGSSYSHLDPTSYAPGEPNSLMAPALKSGVAILNPGPLLLGMLADIGWNIGGQAVATPTFSSGKQVTNILVRSGTPVPSRTATPTAPPSTTRTATATPTATRTATRTATATLQPATATPTRTSTRPARFP